MRDCTQDAGQRPAPPLARPSGWLLSVQIPWRTRMNFRNLLSACFAAALLIAGSSNANAFGLLAKLRGGCCAPACCEVSCVDACGGCAVDSCAAPEASCCEAAPVCEAAPACEPSCCEAAPACEPSCCEAAPVCAPKCKRVGLLARLKARLAARRCCVPACVESSCCDVEPTCSAPACGGGCGCN